MPIIICRTHSHINQSPAFLWFRCGQWPDIIARVISSLGGRSAECRGSQKPKGSHLTLRGCGHRTSWSVTYEKSCQMKTFVSLQLRQHEHVKRPQYWEVGTFFWLLVQSCESCLKVVVSLIIFSDKNYILNYFAIRLCRALCQKACRAVVSVPFLSSFDNMYSCWLARPRIVQSGIWPSLPAACHEVIPFSFLASIGLNASHLRD